MLNASGFAHLPVYRVAEAPIGCSLAEAAESRAYGAYLRQAADTPHALHVIYVNTSLRTKAQAQAIVPTLTCTSSNVISTILQAAAQIPEVEVFYGPDTYMGRNLRRFFEELAQMDVETIRQVHPEHDPVTVRRVLAQFHAFEQGVCIVHHMFGADIAERLRRDYSDAFITAHLEVPGEMFELGLEAQHQRRGVVGSTADILGFIVGKVDEAAQAGRAQRLRFVLGTEASMITSIVRRVHKTLAEHADTGVEVEIIFPVASGAVAQTSELELGVVPGVAAGEGCSVAGGCATCPYMQMNSLDALLRVLGDMGRLGDQHLRRLRPQDHAEMLGGRSVADFGGITIVAMRNFQRTGRLADALVDDVRTRHATRAETG
jgi:quinolinate synthase